MKEDVEKGFPAKIYKIETLRQRGGTEGERTAAATALARIEANQHVRLIRTVIHLDKQETFYETQYRDVEGERKTALIPREFFQHPTKVVEHLVRIGASLPHDNKAAVEFVRKAAETIPEATRRITGRSGWHKLETFVYPGETFGKDKERIIQQGSEEWDPALGLKAGTLRAWLEGLREPCQYSDYLILSLGQKASNLLLEVIGQEEGCILHLHGTESTGAHRRQSSSGKTLSARVAASMTGRCRTNDLPTFGMTELALNRHCFGRNHLGVEIDEKGRADTGSGPRVHGDHAAYLIASGRGSVRSPYANSSFRSKKPHMVVQCH